MNPTQKQYLGRIEGIYKCNDSKGRRALVEAWARREQITEVQDCLQQLLGEWDKWAREKPEPNTKKFNEMTMDWMQITGALSQAITEKVGEGKILYALTGFGMDEGQAIVADIEEVVMFRDKPNTITGKEYYNNSSSYSGRWWPQFNYISKKKADNVVDTKIKGFLDSEGKIFGVWYDSYPELAKDALSHPREEWVKWGESVYKHMPSTVKEDLVNGLLERLLLHETAHDEFPSDETAPEFYSLKEGSYTTQLISLITRVNNLPKNYADKSIYSHYTSNLEVLKVMFGCHAEEEIREKATQWLQKSNPK